MSYVLKKRVLIVIVSIVLINLIIYWISILPKYNFKSSIWTAIQKHDKKEVMLLLSQNPDILREKTWGDYTLLHEAVEAGDCEIVSLLIEKGADVNAVAESSITPLHEAAFYGNTEIVKALLKAGANVKARGYRHEDTPLHIAVIHGYSDIVKILLDAGSDIAARDSLGKTPTDLAFEYNQPQILEIFRHYNPSKKNSSMQK